MFLLALEVIWFRGASLLASGRKWGYKVWQSPALAQLQEPTQKSVA